MELPTYTNIWKIEKRLYKLYDFRLPMPLPVGQVAVFLAIAVPYMLILTMAGMPFSHTWVWLYVLPPGVLAWLVTRPVLEGKRLPELVLSQLRYVSEPRTWCRMAPLAEKDAITVYASVWRRVGALSPLEAAHAGPASAAMPGPLAAAARSADAEPEAEAEAQAAGRAVGAAGQAVGAAGQEAVAPGTVSAPARPVWPTSPAMHAPGPSVQAGPRELTAQAARAARPRLTVRTDGPIAQPPHVVERALGGPAGGPASGWRDRIVVVPGGHRSGKPDQVQRDQARARLPLAGPARIVVLGCTAGAGQTVTTLLTGHLLAGLRGEAVAVLDLGAGPGSLTEQARQIPRLLPGKQDAAARNVPASSRERGLQVVTADNDIDEPADAGSLIDAVAARYPLTLADPAARQVPRAVPVADQLVLVAPANADAAGALAMTLEWLDGHGHAELARRAVVVLNGVSAGTAAQADKAAAVAAGRCRAVVRVPWDDGLCAAGTLGAAAIRAYTALAGVLVSGLAGVAATTAAQARSVGR